MFQLKKWFHPESCIILIFWVTLDQHPFSFEANQGPSRKKATVSDWKRHFKSDGVLLNCCQGQFINCQNKLLWVECKTSMFPWTRFMKKQQALTVLVYCFAASMKYDVFLSCFWKTIMMAALSQTAHDVVYPKLVGKPSNDLMIHRKKNLIIIAFTSIHWWSPFECHSSRHLIITTLVALKHVCL